MSMRKTETRTGVMIYFDGIKPALEDLDDKRCGRLLRAIIFYAETGEKPKLDGMEGLVFKMLIPKIDRDAERYEETREQRQFAVYIREAKKKDEEPLTFSEWKPAQHPASTSIGRHHPIRNKYTASNRV